jgi:two-component system CheB/CheR fusion protein
MAREGLSGDLTLALRAAAIDRKPAVRTGLRVKTNGDFTTVSLTVEAVERGAEAAELPLFLVILEDAPSGPTATPSAIEPTPTTERSQHSEHSDSANARIADLTEQLRAKEEYLRSSTRERDIAHEELKSANEEMQSINEELQSTNEELETSKEELQSVNEELATVNAELQTKVADLSRVNNDMNNLLAGTNIGTVFVDHDLRILRFTPAIAQIIYLIPADIGRPVGHIASDLVGYDDLVRDTQAVLDTLVPKEIEVRTKTDALYAMRIFPYRTLENVIEGAVITFVDITKMRRAEQALREKEDR